MNGNKRLLLFFIFKTWLSWIAFQKAPINIICKQIHSVSEPEEKICAACFSQIAPGMHHDCQKRTAVSNLIFLAFTLGSIQAENVASGILRQKMQDENIPHGTEFTLCTGGKPLNIKVGTPDTKSARRNIKQISLSMIKELQILLELSGRKTVQLISSLRKGLGSRTSIESNIFGQLHDLENSVSEFYNLEKVSYLFCTLDLEVIFIWFKIIVSVRRLYLSCNIMSLTFG